jgi:ligand-binding SRPBCC domain-containing protein
MSMYVLRSKQTLPISAKEAWDFLSDPRNLNEITPPGMSFTITSQDLPATMYQGMVITYKVSPFPGFSFSWVTEITHVVEGQFFVDEQRFGPYAFWHHQHHIMEGPNGVVKMEDIVHFKVPFGFIGQLFAPLLVLPRLRQIFAYRRTKLQSIFPSNSSHDYNDPSDTIVKIL